MFTIESFDEDQIIQYYTHIAINLTKNLGELFSSQYSFKFQPVFRVEIGTSNSEK